MLFHSHSYGELLAVPASTCKCESLSADRDTGPSQINFGHFAGKCFDTCRFRKSEISKIKNEIGISNVLHEGKYWKARIYEGNVENAQIGFEEFRPGISHIFISFHFKKPITLSSQSDPSAPVTVQDLVISPEGIPPKDGTYNLIDAFLNRYPIGIRVLSRSQMMEWAVGIKGHPVKMFDLNLDLKQKNQLLIHSLDLVAKSSFKEQYALFSNNCATKVGDLIDAVLVPDMHTPTYMKLFYSWERSLPVAGPIGTLKFLSSRNLIKPEADAGATR